VREILPDSTALSPIDTLGHENGPVQLGALCYPARSNAQVLKRLSALPVSDVCISVITKSELLFGVEVSPRRRQDQAALSAFLNYIEVLDFPDQASPHYARIRADLKRLGSAVEAKIGANDLFIAAHARSLGLTLVTNNTREFGRVSRLVIENWTVGT
jgi:tRNA(fMet)-specific endonuclease VapC